MLAVHYYQPNAGDFGLSLAFNNTAWIAASGIIALGFWKIAKVGQILYCKSDIYLMLTLACLFLPLLWSSSPWRETSYDRYIGIIAFYLIVITTRQFNMNTKQDTVFWLLIVLAVIIQCLVGTVQAFLMVTEGGSPVRATGSTQQVNIYASWVATGISISMYQFLCARLSRFQKSVHLFMLFIGSFIEYLVMSRTGILGGLLAIVGLCILFRSQKCRCVIAIALISLGILSGIILKHLTPAYERTSISQPGYRTTLYSLSLDLIQESPLQGHGLGQFQKVFTEKRALRYSQMPEHATPWKVAYSHPHNELLFWAVEGGLLPALALFVFFTWLSLRVLLCGKLNHKAALLCVIPILLHTQTEYPLYMSVVHLVILALLIVKATSGEGDCNIKLSSKSSLPKCLAFFTPTLTTLFMLTNLYTIWLLTEYVKTNNYDYMSKIINPLGQVRFVERVQAYLFLKAGAHTLAEELAAKEALLRPSDDAYWNLYNIQLEGGDKASADKTREIAEYYFPFSLYFQDND